MVSATIRNRTDSENVTISPSSSIIINSGSGTITYSGGGSYNLFENSETGIKTMLKNSRIVGAFARTTAPGPVDVVRYADDTSYDFSRTHIAVNASTTLEFGDGKVAPVGIKVNYTGTSIPVKE